MTATWRLACRSERRRDRPCDWLQHWCNLDWITALQIYSSVGVVLNRERRTSEEWRSGREIERCTAWCQLIERVEGGWWSVTDQSRSLGRDESWAASTVHWWGIHVRTETNSQCFMNNVAEHCRENNNNPDKMWSVWLLCIIYSRSSVCVANILAGSPWKTIAEFYCIGSRDDKYAFTVSALGGRPRSSQPLFKLSWNYAHFFFTKSNIVREN